MNIKKNHLDGQRSPYLIQHVHNPVDWYPWSDEAFRKAREEDKPVFLSIGYSTCHWCHVMERESFEDERVAKVMNDAFVCIKVDREERPDIDQFYMSVCQMMTGSGGWPLNLILDNDRKPFFAFTYIPKDSRGGQMGLLDLTAQISALWKENRAELKGQAEKIVATVGNLSRITKGELDIGMAFQKAFQELSRSYDAENGGFGFRPKFPNFPYLMFLLRYNYLYGEKEALEMVEKTLRKIREGGIYDQVGFGLHRYSTDPHWIVPHFEKMLYDQAMAIASYSEAYQSTGDSFYSNVVAEIYAFLLREMRDLEGGFYSAIDADSGAGEGRYYLWSYQEIQRILGNDSDTFCNAFNCTPDGNFMDEATGRSAGLNVLYMAANPTSGGNAGKTDQNAEIVNRGRKKLLEARKGRDLPGIDRKIVTEINALMITALSKAYRATGLKEYLDTAVETADFLLRRMVREDGTLQHQFIRGIVSGDGMLNDYAYLVEAFLELFSATAERRFLDSAIRTNDRLVSLFQDREGGFFTSPYKTDIPVRMKEAYDAPLPSGNSVEVRNLAILSYLADRQDFIGLAEKCVAAFSGMISESPTYFVAMIQSAFSLMGESYFIKVSGQNTESYRKNFLTGISFSPFSTVYPGELSDHTERAEYSVCTMKECRMPVSSLSAALASIAGKHTKD